MTDAQSELAWWRSLPDEYKRHYALEGPHGPRSLWAAPSKDAYERQWRMEGPHA